MHDSLRLGFVQRLDSGRHVPSDLCDGRLGHDANILALTGVPEVLEIRFADQGLLLEHADLGVSALGRQVGPEDRLVGMRAHRKREKPFAKRTVRSRHTDAGNFETLLDRFPRRDRVVADVRAEDGQASFIT